MRRISKRIFLGAAIVLLADGAAALGPPNGPLTRCPADAVVSGAGCMDRFEASVWRVPDPTTVNRALVRKIQTGRATVAELTAGGATQLGTFADDYAPCADSGQSCVNDVYAVSLPGMLPSAFVTWFQAQQACTNSGKRLPSNAEWQAAVAGTPDPGPDDGVTDCNTSSAFFLTATGSRPACVSARGAFDMVGNLWEWVADWVPRSTGCGRWSPGVSPTGDDQCLAGAATSGEPGALLRGGDFGVFDIGATAGPLAVFGFVGPSAPQFSVVFGFRCVR
jgi:formylglycine-generating enzyme required for sulfatase activity